MALLEECNAIQAILSNINYKTNIPNSSLKSNDLKTLDNLNSLLESPFFQKILHIQDSLQILKEKSTTQLINSDCFDINANTGDIQLINFPRESSAKNSSELRKNKIIERKEIKSNILNDGKDNKLVKSNQFIVELKEHDIHNTPVNFQTDDTIQVNSGHYITNVTLNKNQNEDFGIAVKKKDSRLFIESIDKGSIANKNGNINVNDEIIAINGQKIDGRLTTVKHQENIDKINNKITLQLVKSQFSDKSFDSSEEEELCQPRVLQTFTPLTKKKEIVNNNNDKPFYDEKESYDVVLTKNDQGLGITIAGYISDDNKSKILINGIAEGSVVEQDGRISVGDEIIMVGQHSLENYSNEEAVHLLKTTGKVVTMRLIRNAFDQEAPQILAQAMVM